MVRLRILILGPILFFSVSVGGLSGRAAEQKARPNILLIVTDDQRADTIHALGIDPAHAQSLARLQAHEKSCR